MKQSSARHGEKADLADKKLKEILDSYSVKIQDQDKLTKINKINKDIDKLENDWAFNVVAIAGTGLILVTGVVLAAVAAPVTLTAVATGAAMYSATAVFCAGTAMSVSSLFVEVNRIEKLVETYRELEDKRMELVELRHDIAVLSGLSGIQVRVCNYLKIMIMQTDKISTIWRESIKTPVHKVTESPKLEVKKQTNEIPEIIDLLLNNLNENLKCLTTVKYKTDKIDL